MNRRTSMWIGAVPRPRCGWNRSRRRAIWATRLASSAPFCRLSASINPSCCRDGMTTSAQAGSADTRVRDVRVSEDELSVALMDGRTITVPLAWYPRLAEGTSAQRARWEVAGGGYGIHWPDLDEDLSTEGLLTGSRAARGDRLCSDRGNLRSAPGSWKLGQRGASKAGTL